MGRVIARRLGGWGDCGGRCRWGDYHGVYNFGVCGETSTDIRKRVGIELSAVRPTHVFLAFGINDSKYKDGAESPLVSLETFEENLLACIADARVYTDRIVLVGLTRVDERWRSPNQSRFLNEVIAEYDVRIADIAREQNLQFIPMHDVLNIETDLADGLHPNAKGYEKMFLRIREQISFSR